jgi:hypothetical protein
MMVRCRAVGRIRSCWGFPGLGAVFISVSMPYFEPSSKLARRGNLRHRRPDDAGSDLPRAPVEGPNGKFGFYPRFLTAIMAAPAGAQPVTSAFSRYSALPDEQRQQPESACRELTEEIYPGLDLRGEIRTVAARSLGDTTLLWDRDSRLAGFAVCHWGLASEAGEGCCFAKFAAVRPGGSAGSALVSCSTPVPCSRGMPAWRCFGGGQPGA